MAEPAYKAKNIRTMLDNLAESVYGHSTSNSIKTNICVICNEPAIEFKDEISKIEYTISGLCQKCQDFAFGPPPSRE